MIRYRSSLAVRLFVAIAATGVVIIATMALLVAFSMRDGFARYLLRGELTRFDEMEQALVLAYNPAAPGWPEFATDPMVWNDFVRMHFTPPRRDIGPPPDQPIGPPPPGGPAGGDNLMIGERLMLLGPDGDRIAGVMDQSNLFERRAICASDDCTGANLIGYLGLNAPLLSASASDTFFLRRQYVSLALSAIIAILVSAMAAFFVARQILIPIRQLEQGAKTMAAGDYTARIAQDRDDELGQLIGHYNALAATLERTDKAEREWISNTSHELQTPLATLRAQIEAVQDGIRLPNALTFSAMHAAVLRLSRLVQDIKTLSHSREGGLMAAFQTEDLCQITLDVVATIRPLMAEKKIDLDLELPDTMPLKCDRLRIGQVIDNLLQNAIRYTNAPGRIRVRVKGDSATVLLIVEDTPPAPEPTDIPQLFDRFFRAESSRSRAFGGSGLGLSVCKAIVEGHGGTITAGPSDMGGLRMTVSLPKGAL